MRQLPTLSIESPNSPACPSSFIHQNQASRTPRLRSRQQDNHTTTPTFAPAFSSPFPPTVLPSLSLSTAPLRPSNMADSGNAPKPSSSVKLVLLGEAAVGKVRIRRQPCPYLPFSSD